MQIEESEESQEEKMEESEEDSVATETEESQPESQIPKATAAGVKKAKKTPSSSHNASQEESGEESDATEPEESEPESPILKATAAGVKKAKMTPSSSHHVTRKCHVGHHCSYEGPNLKRHLRTVHVEKNHILEQQVDIYFAKGLDGHRRRGPSRKVKTGKKTKGKWKRWCPQPDCHYLGPVSVSLYAVGGVSQG